MPCAHYTRPVGELVQVLAMPLLPQLLLRPKTRTRNYNNHTVHSITSTHDSPKHLKALHRTTHLLHYHIITAHQSKMNDRPLGTCSHGSSGPGRRRHRRRCRDGHREKCRCGQGLRRLCGSFRQARQLREVGQGSIWIWSCRLGLRDDVLFSCVMK